MRDLCYRKAAPVGENLKRCSARRWRISSTEAAKPVLQLMLMALPEIKVRFYRNGIFSGLANDFLSNHFFVPTEYRLLQWFNSLHRKQNHILVAFAIGE
jgi:hypothetical protein